MAQSLTKKRKRTEKNDTITIMIPPMTLKKPSDHQKELSKMNHQMDRLSNQLDSQNLLIQELFHKLKVSEDNKSSQFKSGDPPSYIS